MVDTTERALREAGHSVYSWRKSTDGPQGGTVSKARAFVDGFYSIASHREATKLASSVKPDVVHAHNIFPSLSTSIFRAFRRAAIPIVAHAHNFQLTCPIGTHFRDGARCYECRDRGELRAIAHNCRGSLLESGAYALRSAWLRTTRDYIDQVDALIVPSLFVHDHFVEAGIPRELLVVVENPIRLPSVTSRPSLGRFALFVGRLSTDKGIDLLLQACAHVPEVPVVVAGEGIRTDDYRRMAPSNVTFVGFADEDRKASLYANARFVVAPSVAHETFCLAVADAMGNGLPVVTTRLGAQSGLIEDRVTGRLVSDTDPRDLATALRDQWEDPVGCDEMGSMARSVAARRFSERAYVSQLERVYRRVAATRMS